MEPENVSTNKVAVIGMFADGCKTEEKKEKGFDKNKPIDSVGHWKWIIVFTSFYAQFIAEGITLTFGVFLSVITKDFESGSKTTVSWIASILVGQYHIAGPFGSALVNKFGLRNVSIAGAIMGAVGFGASYFAKNIYLLYFTIGILAGTGLSLLYLPAMVCVPKYFTERRSLAIGISVCGAGVGTLFFEWITGLLLNHFSWREAILITAGMIICTIPSSFLYNVRAPPFPIISTADTTEENAANVRKIFDISLLMDKVFLLFALCDVFMGLGYSIPYLYLPEIEENLTNSKSSILGIIGITNIAGRALTGLIADQIWFNKHLAYSSTLIICGLLTIGSTFLNSVWPLRIYAGLYGTFLGSYMTLKSVNLVEILGLEKLTDAYGMLLLFQAAGFLIGPPIVGALYDGFGGYDPGFYFAGTVIVIGGVLLFFIPAVQKYTQKSKSKECIVENWKTHM